MPSLASIHGCQKPPRESMLPLLSKSSSWPSSTTPTRAPRRSSHPASAVCTLCAMGARWTSFERVSSRSVRGFVSYVCTEIMQCSADILLSPGCKHEHEPSTAVINTNLTSPTPHMLVPLIYSLSTTAKRDIVGRKPRQKIFSRDGSCSVHDAGSWRSGGGDQVYIPLHIQ